MSSEMTQLMIIEDDPVICWDLTRQLRFFREVEVVYFETMMEASKFLQDNRPDLIMTNLRLLDGWINKKFLQHLEFISRPLIVLTGMRDEYFHPEISTTLPVYFIYKPFTPLQLTRTVEKCIRSTS